MMFVICLALNAKGENRLSLTFSLLCVDMSRIFVVSQRQSRHVPSDEHWEKGRVCGGRLSTRLGHGKENFLAAMEKGNNIMASCSV